MTNNPIPSLPEGPADGATQSGWQVPEGWKLVPIEPTNAMLAAAWATASDEDNDEVYKTMIAAAPLPPPPQDKTL